MEVINIKNSASQDGLDEKEIRSQFWLTENDVKLFWSCKPLDLVEIHWLN